LSFRGPKGRGIRCLEERSDERSLPARQEILPARQEILRFAQDDGFAVGSLKEPVLSESEGLGMTRIEI
jgi:hypothetical protein